MKPELVLIALYLACAVSAKTKISCGRYGFNCDYVLSGSVVYECPFGITDIIAYLWNLEEPSDAAFVTIRDCENVEVDMTCTNMRKYFKSLKIENVTNLRFTKAIGPVKNPARVVLKNIKNIAIIPGNTFSISPLITYTGEAQDNELQEIDFENVHIGTIESHAFHSLRGFRNFTWRNVQVDRLQAHAMEISFNTSHNFEEEFSLTNSTIEIAEYLSFQLYVKDAIFKGNKFIEIMPGGINGTIESFQFKNNIVNTLQAGSISIMSKIVAITGNTFNYLKAGCLENIKPGLLTYSHHDFGYLEFRYEFLFNDIIYLDSGSLHPDMNAYDKFSTYFIFSQNTFLCTCENIGWITSPIGHIYSSIHLQNFYKNITHELQFNMCSGLSCNKTIGFIKHLFSNGQCNPNLTLDYFCRTTSLVSNTVPVPAHSNSEEYNCTLGINHTTTCRNSGNIVSNISNIFVIFLTLSIFSNLQNYFSYS